jgi:hypothetical protein
MARYDSALGWCSLALNFLEASINRGLSLL